MPRLRPLLAPYLWAFAFILVQTSLPAHDAGFVRCGFADQLQRAREHGAVITDGPRPNLPHWVEPASGRVRVYYTNTGKDAVPQADLDGTGIPDYVEEAVRALEKAWDIETGTLGYLPPPSDDSAGGSAALDVYLRDMSKEGSSGGGMYGRTNFESQISAGPPVRYTSWMEVDNDFSPTDRNIHGQLVFATTGIDGLRVTTAHELHHTIQAGAYGVFFVQQMLYEFTSTWMEIAVWPELRDWASYTAQLLKQPELYPFSEPSSGAGYGWGWFGQVLHGVAGKHILRSTWEQLAGGKRPFQALVDASQDAGAPLPQLFCDALSVLYRTGSRGRTNTVLPFADSLPEIGLFVDEPVSPPSAIVSGAVRSYDVRAMRFSVPSLIDPDLPVSVTILLTWPDNASFVASEISSSIPYTVTLTNSPSSGDTPLNGTSWAVRVQPPELCFRVEGIQTQRTADPYPLPILHGKQTMLSVPIPSALPGDVATVTWLSPSMVALRKDEYPVVLDDTRIVIGWEVPLTIRPGVYLLYVECEDTATLHKIMVR